MLQPPAFNHSTTGTWRAGLDHFDAKAGNRIAP